MNLPTSLTLLRIAAIPVLVIVYYLPFSWSHQAAAVLFAMAALTDWLDGYLARTLAQSTPFGAFLDPVADKLLVAVSLVVTLRSHPALLLPIAASIIIGREIVISALREWMAEMGKRASVAVTVVAKVKTTLQLIALTLLLWYHPGSSPVVEWVGPMLLYIAASLTLWTMVIYLRIAFRQVL